MAHQVRKRFGQHFLHDPFIIQRIIDVIDLTASDSVIEIGPGMGAMTIPLLQQTKPVNYLALEIDRDVIKHLMSELAHYDNFSVIEANALKHDLASVLPEQESIRIIGNLPYNISTPLIFHFLAYKKRLQDMIFMLQKEVVERMVAAPNSKTYGRLSVMVQAHCHAESLFDVPPGAFKPPPKVMSSMVKLTPLKAERQISNPKLFADVVRDAFNMRRKTIRNSLKPHLTATEIEALNISPTLRAENLSVEDFIKISEFVNQQKA